ncbi:hypothetical protein FJZ27_02640 [Candidatus Peribacteria bacterium]|nr:hypothetical protein [Candidatus Peribacteria bacterium]
MDIDRLPQPPKLLTFARNANFDPTEEFGRQYRALYAEMLGAFPLESDAWSGPTGRKPYLPLHDPAEFLKKQYALADPPTQLRTQEYFSGVVDLKLRKWEANGLTLRGYQKSILSWQPMAWCAEGSKRSSLFIDVTYGAGKSIMGGVNMKFERNMQTRMLKDGVQPEDVPMAGYMVMRKEHALQNALGEQCIVQNPPYTFERTHINQYYSDLTLLYGAAFTGCVDRKAWTALFADEYASYAAAAKAARGVAGGGKTSRDEEMIDAIAGVLTGKIIYVPGPGNRPVPKSPPPRAGDIDTDTYKGDALYGTPPIDVYPVKASHKDLLPGRKLALPEDEGRELLYVMGSSVITGTRTRTRESIRQALQRIGNGGALIGDEMGRFSSEQILHPFTERSEIGASARPHLVGLAADDSGRPGWTRSPRLTKERGVELGVLPRVGYEYIVPKSGKLVSPGTEEAFEQFLEARLADVPLASALKLKQPRERNTIVAVSSAREAVEYMERYAIHCDKKKIPWDVSAYCGSHRRYKEAIRAWFTGPGGGKTLFSTLSDISHAMHLPTLENIEVVGPANVQLLGRLLHNATMIPGQAGSAAARRVTFREHALLGVKPILRQVADEQGIALPAEGLTWVPLEVLVDKSGYGQDEKRPQVQKLKKSAPDIPDASAPRPFTRVGTPLKFTNPFTQEQQRKKEGKVPRTYDYTPDRDGLISEFTIATWLSNEKLGTAWVGSVRMAVRDAFRNDRRGKDLALAAYAKIDSLLEKQGDRSTNGNNGTHEDRGPAVYRLRS